MYETLWHDLRGDRVDAGLMDVDYNIREADYALKLPPADPPYLEPRRSWQGTARERADERSRRTVPTCGSADEAPSARRA